MGIRWLLVPALALSIGGCNRRPLTAQTVVGTDGSIAPSIDAAAADLAPVDVPAEMRADTPADSPAEARVDVPADVPADTRADIPADVPADTRTDVRPDAGDAGEAAPTDGGGPVVDGGCAAAGIGLPAQPAPLFRAPVTIAIPGGAGPGGANATAIGLGDVTGDGRTDVVVGSYHPAIVVYPQMPDGSLGPPIITPIAPGPPGHPGLLDIGDLNGDHRLDVVFHREDGIGFLPGNASGGLGPEQLLPKPAQGIAGSHLAVEDLDGDGRSDLVAMPYLSNGVEVRLQDAAGGLVSAGFLVCPHEGYHTLAIGDADGDGRKDIVLTNGDGRLCVVRQRSGGGFDDGFAVSIAERVNAVAVGNFGVGSCGSAIALVLSGNRPNSRLGVLTWTPAGFTALSLQEAYDLPEHMAVADVDADRRPDLIVMHIGWMKVGVFRGAATGGFAAEELYTIPYINFGADRLAVGDINGDGRPDIVTADFELSILYHQ